MVTLKQAFEQKHSDSNSVLNHMETHWGEVPDWGDLKKSALIGFVNHLKEQMALSSVRRYCAMLKALLNDYKEEVHIPCLDYTAVLTIKKEASTQTWLTMDELSKLERYVPENEKERSVLTLFLIGAYSGARSSDFLEFDSSNIVEDRLMYVSQKTKTLATVPIKPIVRELIEKKEGIKEFSKVTFNATIKEICEKCGINKEIKLFLAGKQERGEKHQFISSHTARRSFASNLYLLGVDIFSISKMMGHSSVEMTKNYIVCGLRDLDPTAMEYFK